jgi:hypothetical protein
MRRLASLALAVTLLGTYGCVKDPPPPVVEASAPPPVEDAGADVELAVDARADAVAALRDALDAGAFDGPFVRATTIQTSVVSEPTWPDDAGTGPSTKLGTLRIGSPVPAVAEPVVNDDCPEGWYELVEGGWVCGKRVTLDANDPHLKYGPGPARIEDPLPYRYGVVLSDGAPLYKRILSVEKRQQYEPNLIPPKKKREAEADENPYEEEEDEAPKRKVTKIRGRDGGKPTLGDLKGRRALARRMMTGFLLSLDRDIEAAGTKWWRTAQGNVTPYERVAIYGSPAMDFFATWLGGEAPDGGAPLAPSGQAAVIKVDFAAKYAVSADGKQIGGAGGLLPKMSAVALAGDPVPFYGVPYQQTTQGFWIRLSDAAVSKAEAPADLTEHERWIDVDLTRQLVVAFEGKAPAFATLVSSGRRNPWDPEHDFPTPTGTFRIREKHVTTTMDGDLAADGPYSIEDVPWVMYFKGSYALHGAFWHRGFGHPRSHGCVNLAPKDARALFLWAEPRLPSGWHSVYATPAHAGSRVIVHEDAKDAKDAKK